jgi:hypothetical protein
VEKHAELFVAPVSVPPIGSCAYDVAADGKRFLFNSFGDVTTSKAPITVVLNWVSTLSEIANPKS